VEGKTKCLDECIKKELTEEWPVWRLVVSGKATLTEIETSYTLDDLMRINAVMDIRDASEILAGEE
jgi:hypothetical protein